jgi:hypothetical protein
MGWLAGTITWPFVEPLRQARLLRAFLTPGPALRGGAKPRVGCGSPASARHLRALLSNTRLPNGSRVAFANRSHVVASARYSSALINTDSFQRPKRRVTTGSQTIAVMVITKKRAEASTSLANRSGPTGADVAERHRRAGGVPHSAGRRPDTRLYAPRLVARAWPARSQADRCSRRSRTLRLR